MARSVRMLQLDLAMLCIFKRIQEDRVIGCLVKLLEGIECTRTSLYEVVGRYNEFVYQLAKRQESLSFKAYLQEVVVYGDNLLAMKIESGKHVDENLLGQVKIELKVLEQISNIKAVEIKEQICKKGQDKVEQMMLVDRLMEWHNHLTAEENHIFGLDKWDEKIIDLLYFYKEYGCGDYGRHQIFYMDDEGELIGVRNNDIMVLSDIVGYDTQKEDLVGNTKLFANGKTANNILLYGSRGTGKSSMVKALMKTKELGTKLRLIELRKDQLMGIKKLFGQIKDKPYRFILFIDDLAFEEKTEAYTMLKTMLEGGVEAKPRNVIIYATSNRRHLVKEYTSDNEIHGREAVEEKMSLSDRFGLRIYFPTPNGQEYLDIVRQLASEKGVTLESGELEKRALQWEMWNNGKSGRTARQFVDSLDKDMLINK